MEHQSGIQHGKISPLHHLGLRNHKWWINTCRKKKNKNKKARNLALLFKTKNFCSQRDNIKHSSRTAALLCVMPHTQPCQNLFHSCRYPTPKVPHKRSTVDKPTLKLPWIPYKASVIKRLQVKALNKQPWHSSLPQVCQSPFHQHYPVTLKVSSSLLSSTFNSCTITKNTEFMA